MIKAKGFVRIGELLLTDVPNTSPNVCYKMPKGILIDGVHASFLAFTSNCCKLVSQLDALTSPEHKLQRAKGPHTLISSELIS